MHKRLGSIVGVVAIAALGLVLSAPEAGAAGGTITPSSTTVRVGGNLEVTSSGCEEEEIELPDDGFAYRYAAVLLTTGTGAAERLAGPVTYREAGPSVEVPGWVDPAQPATLVGTCELVTYTEDGITRTTEFTFPDVAIDVTPAVGTPITPTFTLNRDTAAGGQVIRISGSGCTGFDGADAFVTDDADLSGRTPLSYAAFGSADVAPDGTFTIDLALNRVDDDFGAEGPTDGGPLAEGDRALFVSCSQEVSEDDSRTLLAEPALVHVVGSRPSGSIALEPDDAGVTISGSGCTGGDTVSLHVQGYADDDDPFEFDRQRARGLATGSGRDLAAADEPLELGEIDETHEVVPGADGTWSLRFSIEASTYSLRITADCGDPAGTGFRYADLRWYASSFPDLFPTRTSPTSSPVGGPVEVHVQGECEEGATVAIIDRQGEVLSESGPITLGEYGLGSGTVTAPSTPGQYYVTGTCDGEIGYPDRYEVFAPTTLAPDAPLPAEPTTGWPSTGERETYHGKLGPIDLSGDLDMEMDVQRALGGSELGIPVPRPDGDFAITGLRFDLVDAQGTPVPQGDAHLHHFVFANLDGANAACPDGTFGLPGEIVGAAGAERTAVTLPDPYGIVVEDTDNWAGVYDLMNMSGEDQTVFLTYDIELRRDVQNVRPVTNYFGSASGCDTFTWDLDGSGTPDVQSTYVTIAEAGRLIGSGSHIHNGGSHTELVNDRDRRLCRAELHVGEPGMHEGHGGMDDDEDVGYPPEMYPDDPMIEGIDTCALNESVSAGERLRFDAVYDNERARSGVMGIYTAYVWEGGGPAAPEVAPPGGATPIPGRPNYAG